MKRTYLGAGMLVNYLLLALRNLKKQRGYAIINTIGLAIGLASALFIFLYVHDELTFDTQHPHATQTYRLGSLFEFPNGESQAYPGSPAGWDNYLMENYNEITGISSFSFFGMPTSIHYLPADKIILTQEIIWAERNLKDVLSIPIIRGHLADPLTAHNSLIISETAARELFGEDDPLNKTVSISNMYATKGQKIEMVVAGVYRDLPSNTHVRPKYICNVLALKAVITDLENRLNSSMGEGNNTHWTQSFFVCANASKIKDIRTDLEKIANTRFNQEFKLKPLIQNITDVHFDQETDWAIKHKSADKKYIYVFVTIAILILIVACINYINLSTAKSVTRAREIGLRKTFGGIRVQLFAQFMTESFLLVLIAMLIALQLVIIFIPQFNNLTGKTFSSLHVFNTPMMLVAGAVVVFVTLLAGSYPALFMSGFQPASVLKGRFAFRKGSNTFRQLLTTLQFIVAVILLTGTVIVVRQMDLMRNSKLNEAGRQIVSIRYGGFSEPTTDSKYITFKNLILQDPEIESVTLANHLPKLDYFGTVGMQMQFPEISEQQHDWFQLNGDFDFPETFKLKIIAGRNFDSQNIADSSAILLNESAVKALKLTPDKMIGKTVIRPDYMIPWAGPDTTRTPVTGLVVGVVEDFPYQSMHKKIGPLAISPKPHSDDRIIYVRLPAKSMNQKIASLERAWKQVFPDFGFDYWFVDEEFGRMYENEIQVSQLTEKFSALAILIACVGIYGLAAFLSEQRTKEIGIRKTFGANNIQILFILMSVFAKLLAVACVIGVPIAYYLSSKWLEGFVYQTSLSFLVFVGAIGLIAIVTMLTVGYESLKASMANPVTALKHE
jgi:putative ABC transport system permease protein